LAAIDFQESGSGPPVLFVPGSFATPAAWRAMLKLLPGFRLAATSILGYGGTAETRRLGDLDMAHEVRVVEAAAERIGQPVHLVGHSFGGTIALAAALAARIEVRSIATFEANPLLLIAAQGRADLFEQARAMAAGFEAAHHAGERDAAGRVIDYWGGSGAFAALPQPVQDYCRRTAYANVLDWRTAFAFGATPADYARIAVPVLLVRGGKAVPAMVEITEALTRTIPRAERAVVEGAGHFLISTHPTECAALLRAFLTRHART
jgi:pimeloyl-ACP methyl ester carboxylesterase